MLRVAARHPGCSCEEGTLTRAAFKLKGLTDDDVREIGALVILWNQIELLMQMIAMQLLRIPHDVAETIMKGPSMPFQSEVLIAAAASIDVDKAPELIKSHISNLKQEVTECAKRFQALANFRNDVVHGRIMISGRGMDEKTYFVKKGTSKQIPIAKIYQKTDEMMRLSERLQAVMLSLGVRARPGG